VLLHEVSTRADGYNLIGKYLHQVKIDAEGSSDFLYMINRPRPSRVLPESKINRLSKWSVANLQSINMQFQLATDTPVSIHASPPLEQYDACRLELDISTPGERGDPIPSNMLEKVLGELIELSLEIASDGDIK